MSKLVLPLVALLFCTWAVSLAGVASLQDKCEPGWSAYLSNIIGFSAGLPCMETFRFHWFVVVLEFVLIVGAAATVATGFLAKSRASWIGLFAVATLLYIQMSDTYLSAQDAFKAAGVQDRSRTMTAGCIMTATVNCLLILAMGIVEDVAAPAKETTNAV